MSGLPEAVERLRHKVLERLTGIGHDARIAVEEALEAELPAALAELQAAPAAEGAGWKALVEAIKDTPIGAARLPIRHADKLHLFTFLEALRPLYDAQQRAHAEALAEAAAREARLLAALGAALAAARLGET